MQAMRLQYPSGRLQFSQPAGSQGRWCWTGSRIAIVLERDLEEAGFQLWKWPLGRVVQLGPYECHMLKHDWEGCWYVMAPNDWRAAWWLFWDRIRRTAGMIEVFIVRVAVIWELAIVPEKHSYHWRHIHAIGWLARLFGRN